MTYLFLNVFSSADSHSHRSNMLDQRGVDWSNMLDDGLGDVLDHWLGHVLDDRRHVVDQRRSVDYRLVFQIRGLVEQSWGVFEDLLVLEYWSEVMSSHMVGWLVVAAVDALRGDGVAPAVVDDDASVADHRQHA